MFCKKCGTEHPDTDPICPKCDVNSSPTPQIPERNEIFWQNNSIWIMPLIVILVCSIGVWCFIVLPIILHANRKAKDSTIKANLQILRNAIEVYKMDTGIYPTSPALKELYIKPSNKHAKRWKGPYLKGDGSVIIGTPIPANPYAIEGWLFDRHTSNDVSKHWIYTPKDSKIVPNPDSVPATDAEGGSYSLY